MKMGTINSNKGVAGLTILLSLVTMLFAIGLLVMILSLMGGELQDATWDSTVTTVTNETVTVNASSNGTSAYISYNNFVMGNVTVVFNLTGETIPPANVSYTTAGVVYQTADYSLDNATWENGVNITYSFTYDASNDATEIMGNTTDSISSVTDWFDIFIVIGAMVVLILLTVIIITAIRGSGLMDSGGA